MNLAITMSRNFVRNKSQYSSRYIAQLVEHFACHAWNPGSYPQHQAAVAHTRNLSIWRRQENQEGRDHPPPYSKCEAKMNKMRPSLNWEGESEGGRKARWKWVFWYALYKFSALGWEMMAQLLRARLTTKIQGQWLKSGAILLNFLT